MSGRAALIAFGCAVALGSAAPARAQEAPADPLRARVDRLAAPLIEGELVVGMTVGVLDAAGPRVFGYGRLARAREAPPDGRTLFEIGSVSKVFTGVLLAVAGARGEATLDTPAQRFLPETVRLATHGERAITLLDLATHTSGLPRMPDNFAPADPTNPYADYTVVQLHEFLGRARLAAPPGTRHEYSNLGMGLLGQLLERASGAPYAELLRTRIAEPLALADTCIAIPADRRARLAPGHDPDGEPAANWDIRTLEGAGAIRSTTDDCLRFLRACLHPPEALAAPLALASRPHRHRPGGAMGLGWHLDADGTAWHNGQTGGYHSFLAFHPATRVAVAVLANSATGAVDDLGRRVLALLRGGDPAPPEVPPALAVPPETLARYEGRYRLRPEFELTITRDDARLYAQATDQPRFRIYPKGDREFAWRVVEARLEFEASEGPCPALVLDQNGMRIRGERIP